MKFIKNLKEISKKDISITGGKGANLGEMVKIKMSVPPGFIILSSVFEKFLEETNISVEIKAAWNKINIKDIESIEKGSETIRALILKAEMPKDIEKEILSTFGILKVKRVAVRSSATAEDSKIDSWAGELESYLNTTKGNVIKNVKKCWASLYSPRALFYRAKRGLKNKKVNVAVVIQKMIQSDVSGVCFTVHPVTKNRNQMIIEAVLGLGEVLVQGKVTPDSYVIEKNEFKILNINIPQRERQKLSAKQIKELARICSKIEKHYRMPQDIEWSLEKNKFYIVQTRPITTL